MAKSYADIQKEIAALQKTAEAMKQKEVAGVIERIKVAIETYGLTAADLGLAGKAIAPAKRAKRVKKAAAGRGKATSVVRFRDEAGNSWSGRGRRPAWYLAAIAAGKTPQDLKA